MREITVRELAEALKGEHVEVISIDCYGISVSMTKARVTYEEGVGLLAFTSGSHHHGGVGSVAYKVDDCLECISYDEERSEYTIKFSQYMPDITITKSQVIRKAV